MVVMRGRKCNGEKQCSCVEDDGVKIAWGGRLVEYEAESCNVEKLCGVKFTWGGRLV